MQEAKFLSDEPLATGAGGKADSLNFKRYSTILANFARNTPGPFTIGLHAEWGYGKTSLLRMIAANLGQKPGVGQPEVITVWFNAWQYEAEEHPLIPLVLTVRDAILQAEHRYDDGIRQSLHSVSNALTDVVAGTLASLHAKVGTPAAEVGVDGRAFLDTITDRRLARKRAEQATQQSTKRLEQKALYYRAFQELDRVCLELKQRQIKVVVLIDDLDRCEARKAYELLEAIKLVLGQPGFIFFLAVDHEMLEAYLNKKYGEELGIKKDMGAFYLQKLIQVPFHIPTHREQNGAFIRSLLNGHGAEVDAQLAGVADILGSSSSYNPRFAIRTINTILLLNQIYLAKTAEQGQQPDTDMLPFFAVSVILRSILPEFYKNLLSYSATTLDHAARWDYKAAKPEKMTAEQDELWSFLTQRDNRRAQEILSTDLCRQWLQRTNSTKRATACDLVLEQRVPIAEADRTYANLITDGNAKSQEGKYEEALELYKRATALNPRHGDAHYNRGVTLYDLKRYDEAIAAYTEAIRLNPNDAWAFNNRGVAYANLDRYEEALADYSRGIALDPKHVLAYENRGYQYFKNFNMPDKARADFETVRKLDPNYKFRRSVQEFLDGTKPEPTTISSIIPQ